MHIERYRLQPEAETHGPQPYVASRQGGISVFIPGTWYPVQVPDMGTRYLVPCTWYLDLVSGTWYLEPGARCQVPGATKGGHVGYP